MKRILVLLVFLFFLAVIFHGSPGNISAQEEKDDVQDEGVTELPPDMIIKDIQVGWKNRSVLTRKAKGIDDIEIPVREGNITIHIYRSQKYSGNDLLYEFKLEGFDREWTQDDAGMKQVKYVYLKPGNYVFKIKRSLLKEEEISNTVEESVRVIIIPPFWMTWWFRLSVLLLVIGLLYTFFKLKLRRREKIRRHELKISQMQSQLSRAELKALKAQLHPHFLFNTLNVISSLMHENVEAADNVITRLGDLLRLMFSHSGRKMVRLKDEIEFITIYLELHRVRFQDKLAVTLDTAGDTLEALVPNFLLQPLVENAVQHGISKDKNDNKILVRSQKKDNRLCLSIRDNGPGIPQLETGDFINIKGGFGLKNTLERLKIQYGADFKFKLENSPEGGLIVLIEIPYNSNQGDK